MFLAHLRPSLESSSSSSSPLASRRDVWVLVSSSPSSSSSSPSSKNESKCCSESGDNRISGTGTCLCLNQNTEGDLFFPQTTVLWGTILVKADCGCEHGMTWKNQQMEMKEKGMPKVTKGKRQPWQVKEIVREKGSQDVPLFCVARWVRLTPKQKLWANWSKKWMAIANEGGRPNL